MQTISLRCPSVTYAQKGRQILARAGIPCRLARYSRFGCSYGLEVAADRETALALLREAGVPCSPGG
ncbi:MAG: DUF3343 domain-containing protein [Clostridia bacterium]|nr:DUF3343 domain-containing protein [Clostridia bacterium]